MSQQRRQNEPRSQLSIRKFDQHDDSNQDEEETELVGVIVSLRHGTSYDPLFTSIKQKTAPGTRLSIYLIENMMSPNELQDLLQTPPDSTSLIKDKWGEDATQLVSDITTVEPASVVFNWECCSSCTDRGALPSFGGTESPMPLMSYLMRRSFMVMCSDFSLKALIHDWDPTALGANPFTKVGEFGNNITLRFQPTTLAACQDSAQLQILGELCHSGEAHVHALGGTIAFVVNDGVTPTSHPRDCANGWNSLQVLTIATALDGRAASTFVKDNSELSHIGDYSGLVGHCLLQYPSGGRLLVSCPHWIELSKLDVSAERLMQVAEERYGADVGMQMQQDYVALSSEQERARYVQQSAQMFVQQTAPQRYSSFKKSSD